MIFFNSKFLFKTQMLKTYFHVLKKKRSATLNQPGQPDFLAETPYLTQLQVFQVAWILKQKHPQKNAFAKTVETNVITKWNKKIDDSGS